MDSFSEALTFLPESDDFAFTADQYLGQLRRIKAAVGVPVIASGGAGELEHLAQALNTGADAALCASIFHYGRHTVGEAKEFLMEAGIPVRTG